MFKNRRGASLIMVIMLMFFVMIVGLGVVAIAGSSSGQTTVALTQRQADLTAQSVLNAVTSAVSAGSVTPGTAQIAGNATDPKLGSYSYTITSYNVALNQYKIAVDAWYPKTNQGSESKMNRIIQKTGSSFSNIAMATGTAANNSIVTQTYGDLMINSDFLMHNNGSIYGNIDVNGTLNLGNGQFYILPDPSDNKPVTVHVANDLLITSTGGNLQATFYVGDSNGGNFSASTGALITGDVYVNGNVNLSGGFHIIGNIYSKGTVSLSGGAVVTGNVDSGSTVSNGGTITGTIKQNDNTIASKIPAFTENITASPATIPTISGTLTANFASQSSYTFNTGGYLTLSNFQWVGSGSNAGNKVILDASNQDLYISLATPSTTSGSTITIDNQADLLTYYNDLHPHNVYLYLSDNAGTKYVNLNLGSSGNNFVGDQAYYNKLVGLSTPAPETRAPNLYIISNGPSNISINGTGAFYGYIYDPNGKVNFDNQTPNFGSTTPPKLTGAVVSSSIVFDGNNIVEQFYPTSVQFGTGTGGSGGWNTLGTYVGN